MQQLQLVSLADIKKYLKKHYNVKLNKDGVYEADYDYEHSAYFYIQVYNLAKYEKSVRESIFNFDFFIHVLGKAIFYSFEVEHEYQIDIAMKIVESVIKNAFEKFCY